MGLWKVTYEMVVESDVAVEQTQLVVDVLEANSYYELLNKHLQKSVETALVDFKNLPKGAIHIEVDVVECVELANIDITKETSVFKSD